MKNPNKKKGCRMVLIVVLIVIFIIMLGGFTVIKSYLCQIGRTYDQNLSETITPESEYFETDETEEPFEMDTETVDQVLEETTAPRIRKQRKRRNLSIQRPIQIRFQSRRRIPKSIPVWKAHTLTLRMWNGILSNGSKMIS